MNLNELMCEDKKINFCKHFIPRLEEYNISDPRESVEKSLDFYRQILEASVETFNQKTTAIIQKSQSV